MILVRFRRFNDDGSVRLESPVIRVPDTTTDGRDALEVVMAAAERHFGPGLPHHRRTGERK